MEVPFRLTNQAPSAISPAFGNHCNLEVQPSDPTREWFALQRTIMREADSLIEIIENGVITRTRSFAEQREFSGCVHYPDGRPCERSMRPSEGVLWKPVDTHLSARTDELPVVDGAAIFAGHLPRHFGHFLVEAPARLWIFDHAHEWSYIVFNKFVTGDAADRDDEKVVSLLAAFEIAPHRLMILDEDTRFRSVIVPSAMFTPGQPISSRLKNVYRRWRANLLTEHESPGPRRIYLSRKKIETQRGDRSFNETILESFFEHRGYTVIYPESLPFAQQARLVAGAEVVAGLGGSALHLSVFMKATAQTIVLGTHRWPGPNRVQIACNELSGASLSFFPFAGQESADPTFRFAIDLDKLDRFLAQQPAHGTAPQRTVSP